MLTLRCPISAALKGLTAKCSILDDLLPLAFNPKYYFVTGIRWSHNFILVFNVLTLICKVLGVPIVRRYLSHNQKRYFETYLSDRFRYVILADGRLFFFLLSKQRRSVYFVQLTSCIASRSSATLGSICRIQRQYSPHRSAR